MAFSPAEIASFVVAAFAFLLCLLNVIDKAYLLKQRNIEPEIEQNDRIAHLEEDVREMKVYLTNDNTRIKMLEESNRVMLEGMSALLSHGIDGNNEAEMRKAREKMQSFLISK